ncbi:MAG: ankyrin repeat domain-containing protein [Pseudomonadota bacterium]|nr:ankyrin repeat domain-containing protein [Pseudomonadota bacterium]
MKRKKHSIHEIPDSYSDLFGGFVAEMASKVSIFVDIDQGSLSKEVFFKKYNFLESATLDDIENESNFTPLMWAVYHNRIAYVEALIELGADINDQSNIMLSKEVIRSRTSMQVPLFSSTYIKNCHAERYVTYDGWHTPLSLAIQCGYEEIFDLLLSAKADIHALIYKDKEDQNNTNVQDSLGINAFSYAVIFERVAMVQKLINSCETDEIKQTMINQKTDDLCKLGTDDFNGAIFNGGYPLFYAVRAMLEKDFDILNILLANGANTSLSIRLNKRAGSSQDPKSYEVSLKDYVLLYPNFLEMFQIIERYVPLADIQKDDLKAFHMLHKDAYDFMIWECEVASNWMRLNIYQYFNFSDQLTFTYNESTYDGHLIYSILSSLLKLSSNLPVLTFLGKNFLPTLFNDYELAKHQGSVSPLNISIFEEDRASIAFCLRNQFTPLEYETLKSLFSQSLSNILYDYKKQHDAFHASNEKIIQSCARRLLGQVLTNNVSGQTIFFYTEKNEGSDDDSDLEDDDGDDFYEANSETDLIPYVLMLQKKEVLERVNDVLVAFSNTDYKKKFLFRIHTLTDQILKEEVTLEDKPNTDAMLALVSDFPWLFNASAILKYPDVRKVYQQYLTHSHTNPDSYSPVLGYIIDLMHEERRLFYYDDTKQFLVNLMMEHCHHHHLWDVFPDIKAGMKHFSTIIPDAINDSLILNKIISYYGPSVSMFESIKKIVPCSNIDALNSSQAIKNDFRAFIEDSIVNNGQLDNFVLRYYATKSQYNVSSEMNDIIIEYAEHYNRSEILNYLQTKEQPTANSDRAFT